MAKSQFLVRNRHNNIYYGRVVIPPRLRHRFAGKRELRLSLGTADKKHAKRKALAFWVQCQTGFEQLVEWPAKGTAIASGRAFVELLEQRTQGGQHSQLQ